MDPADDENLAPEKQLDIAKKMFIGGFFFLPWLWLCNYLFFREHLNKPNSPSAVKFYAKASLIGFAIQTTLFLIWMIVYLVNHNNWGATGDAIAINIPDGS